MISLTIGELSLHTPVALLQGWIFVLMAAVDFSMRAMPTRSPKASAVFTLKERSEDWCGNFLSVPLVDEPFSEMVNPRGLGLEGWNWF